MDGWHFPRTELANQYLNLFSIGLSSSFAIIAPRRKGKTLFILQDLAPIANKNNYIPVYASLWSNINSPHQGIIAALEDAIAAIDKKKSLKSLISTKIAKTTISNDLLGKVEVEFADTPAQASANELSYLNELLSELMHKAGKKTVILLIDEIQHLATSPQFDALAHSLRTLLDSHQGAVKSLFTGSSRHYMNLLFNEAKSPFYHFIEVLPFPDLDKAFLQFLQQRLLTEYNMPVTVDSLLKAFKSFDHSPYWMLKMVSHLLTFKVSAKTAMDYTLKLIEATEDFEGLVKNMKPIDKLVFLALCEGNNPYSKSLLAAIDQQTDVKGVKPNVQRSLKRLQSASLISHIPKSGYAIEKPGLRSYLEDHG